MKVQLGIGEKYKDGWINVDLYADRVDVREDLRTVEFDEGSVSRILLVHTIEHVNLEDGTSLLRKCFKWLKPSGIIEIETPDRDKCFKLILKGNHLKGAKGLFGGRSNDKSGWHAWLKEWAKACEHSFMETIIPTKWENPGERHLHVWTDSEMATVMQDIGYGYSIERPQHHGRRHWRDMRVVGTKPCE